MKKNRQKFLIRDVTETQLAFKVKKGYSIIIIKCGLVINVQVTVCARY